MKLLVEYRADTAQTVAEGKSAFVERKLISTSCCKISANPRSKKRISYISSLQNFSISGCFASIDSFPDFLPSDLFLRLWFDGAVFLEHFKVVSIIL